MTKQRSSSSRSGGGVSSAAFNDDEDLTSLLRLPTRDIADRLNAMLETGRRPHYRCGDYLCHHVDSCSTTAASSRCTSQSRSRSSRRRNDRSNNEINKNKREQQTTVTPASRAMIIRWLSDCADYLELPRECVAAAAGYVDRFMSSTGNSSKSNKVVQDAKRDPTVLQLVAISSLFLASKQHSDKLSLVDADVLARVSHGSYSAQEILDMEVVILKTLGWRLCGPTVRSLACHFVALLSKVISKHSNATAPKRRRSMISSVVDFTMLQCDLSISDYGLSVLQSSEDVALASVLSALDLVDSIGEGERRAFDRALFDWCGMDVRSDGVEDASDMLHDLFGRQTNNDIVDHAASSLHSIVVGDGAANKERSFHSTRSPVCVAAELGTRKVASREEQPHPSSRRAPKDTRKGRNHGQRSRWRVPLEP